MQKRSINELLEDAADRQILQHEADQRDHEELMRPRDLESCHWMIKGWKRWYFRKNSKLDAQVSLLTGFIPCGDGLLPYYRIQLFINNDLKEEYNVKPEAFDTLIAGLEKREMPGIDRFTYLHHERPIIFKKPRKQ